MTETVALLNKKQVDVIALQEVDNPTTCVRVLQIIRSQTDLKHIASMRLSPSSFEDGGSSGVAIATRFPLWGVYEDLLPNPNLPIKWGEG